MRELTFAFSLSDPFTCQLAVICLCGGCYAGADPFACQFICLCGGRVICLCGGCVMRELTPLPVT